VSLPSAQEMAIRRNHEARGSSVVGRRDVRGQRGYAMTADDAIAAASLMDRSSFSSPLAGMPTAASVGQFSEAKSFFGDSDGSGGEWDDFYDAEQSGYNYENLAGAVMRDARGKEYQREGEAVTHRSNRRRYDRSPVPISIKPTSTTNPERPRTVAAGYDESRRTLTVVFRDGTFYNYYEVEAEEWDQFRAAYSKGHYILYALDAKPRGTARMANAALAAREGLYRIARTGQWTQMDAASQFDASTGKKFKASRGSDDFYRVNPTQQWKPRRKK
jgi:hypothetical protein